MKKGLYSLAGVIVVLAVLVAANYLLGFGKQRVDLTKDRLFTLSDGTRKVTAISEITGMEEDAITMQDIFVFERQGLTASGRVKGAFRATGIRPKCSHVIAQSGINLPRQMFEHEQAVA